MPRKEISFKYVKSFFKVATPCTSTKGCSNLRAHIIISSSPKFPENLVVNQCKIYVFLYKRMISSRNR